jgi:hypothetical protein
VSLTAVYAVLGGGGIAALVALAIAALKALQRGKDDAAAAERGRIVEATAARAERQNKVLQKEVTDDDLQKSLKDGTF